MKRGGETGTGLAGVRRPVITVQELYRPLETVASAH